MALALIPSVALWHVTLDVRAIEGNTGYAVRVSSIALLLGPGRRASRRPGGGRVAAPSGCRVEVEC